MAPDSSAEREPLPTGDDAAYRPLRPRVYKFRQIILWPVQLIPRQDGAQIQRHWEVLSSPAGNLPWREVADEFTGNPADFSERHYKEFVTFLPYVQRFLYGEGGPDERSVFGRSSIKVFRRQDVAQARVVFPNESAATLFDKPRQSREDLDGFRHVALVTRRDPKSNISGTQPRLPKRLAEGIQ